MQTIKTLIKCVRDYKKSAALTPTFVALEVVLECVLPFVMAKLIDCMQNSNMTDVFKYGGILIVVALLSLFFGTLSGKSAATASCGYAKNLRHDLYHKVQDFSFTDIDAFSTSSLVTRLTTDVTNVQNAFQMIIRIAVRTPLMLIFSIIMSFGISPHIAWIFLTALPIIGIALYLMMRFVMPIFKRVFKKYDLMNNAIQEDVSGIRVVKSFVRESYETERFTKTSNEVCRDFTKAEKLMGLASPFMNFCIYILLMIVNFFGAKLIIESGATSLTTGELSSLTTYGIQSLMSIMMLCMVIVMISMSVESANRISEVLNHEPSLESTTTAFESPAVSDGSIVFDHVSFKYTKDSAYNSLSDINLNIKSGETVGIIGSTGSSKTTLIQLIPRLYDATDGHIYVGGHDVRDYELEALRNSVSLVLQKNVLFSGTVKENLRWGNKEATDNEIVHACKVAQADEFVTSLKDGYDTYIEQGGTNVSGGQKQRLCIARALLKKPKILIFDDSTSAVDTKTDALIRKALKSEMPDVTKLIIAQRIASVKDADRILVLDGGRIVEEGTHDSLVAKDGIYAEIYYSQTQSNEKEA